MSTSISSVSGAMDSQSIADQNRQRMQSLNSAAASYLGLSQQDLRTQLDSGKSMADVATAQGKSIDGLKAALTAATQSGSSAGTASATAKGSVPNGIDYIINSKNGTHPSHHHHHGGGTGGGAGGPGGIMSPLSSTGSSASTSSPAASGISTIL